MHCMIAASREMSDEPIFFAHNINNYVIFVYLHRPEFIE